MSESALEMQERIRIAQEYSKQLNRLATIAGILLLGFTIIGLVLGFMLGHEYATMSGPARFSFHATGQHLRAAWECFAYAMQNW